MREFTTAQLIWNRATEGESIPILPGDRALEDMLLFHGVAMNGGVFHALGSFRSEELGDDGLEDIEAGYRYFGLDGIADFLNEVKSVAKADHEMDAWEDDLNRRYDAIVPDDEALFARFEITLLRSPSDFAPL